VRMTIFYQTTRLDSWTFAFLCLTLTFAGAGCSQRGGGRKVIAYVVCKK